jgi:hypothetical protein
VIEFSRSVKASKGQYMLLNRIGGVVQEMNSKIIKRIRVIENFPSQFR